MITEHIKKMIENSAYIYVATSDLSGQPHIAIGEQVTISGESLLVFENWFCPSTLQNITCNSHVSVVAVMPDSANGYQMLGTVIRNSDRAILDGYDPSVNSPSMPPMPQVLTRFTVKVDQILEFSSGIHSDLPLVK